MTYFRQIRHTIDNQIKNPLSKNLFRELLVLSDQPNFCPKRIKIFCAKQKYQFINTVVWGFVFNKIYFNKINSPTFKTSIFSRSNLFPFSEWKTRMVLVSDPRANDYTAPLPKILQTRGNQIFYASWEGKNKSRNSLKTSYVHKSIFLNLKPEA